MANILSYDQGVRAADPVAPGERIPGPPGPGLLVLWIGWIAIAVLLVGLGGAVFLGILQAAAG
jgi:hypothetical protein